jgi:signal transduction histidine kinase
LRAAAGIVVVCGLVLLAVGVVRAEPGVSLHGELDGVPLGQRIALLEDRSGKLTLQDVQKPEVAALFRAGSEDAPSFGYSSSAYWLRIRVEAERPRSWLLELTYPLLDDIALYVPNGDGSFHAKLSGDSRPFKTRDLSYRSFVFALEEPAHTSRTYYLRVRSTSSLNLALRAWDMQHFVEYQPRDLGMLFLFYGVLFVMACYNFCMWLFVRQRELLQYTLFIVATGVLQFSLSGHMFQFVLPNQPAWAAQMIPFSVALSLASACFVGLAYLSIENLLPQLRRLIKTMGLGLLLLAPLSAPLPYVLRMRLLIGLFACLVGFALLPALLLIRMRTESARIYIVAWSCVALGFAVTGLRTLGWLPVNFVTEWAAQLGSMLQLVLLSTALADRINAMRADVSALNGELSRKVELLEEALLSAENATTRAEQATRVKDEFMATMSHELRTPLNAIINVPQGLLRDFPRADAVACSHCNSTFELEHGEKVTRETPCPECGQVGTLKPKLLTKYSGKPEHTARYLQMIERSGKHLLQMVNGLLDFSKLELGRLELVLESFDVAELVREVEDETMLYAERMGVRIELNIPKSEILVADPVRVKQVLINLLSNAVKFSDGAGVVQVGLVSRPDAVELFVKDQGIGIAPEHFERIFASFEQVHKGNTRKYGGTGLGLSISRSLVRMHGGELWVESELGKGAKFSFRIPRGLMGGRSRTVSTKLKSVTNSVRHGEEMAS